MGRKAGEQVLCNGCNTPILELITDVNFGDRVGSNQFKGINGHPDPKYGEELICSLCHQSYAPAFNDFIFRSGSVM